MSRVTSLTSMPEAQLNRWIKRIGLLLFVGVVAFAAFYAIDRVRLPQATIADKELTALEEAVRKDPSDIAARGKLADTYVAKERYEDAIVQYTAIIDSGNDLELAHLSRARAFQAMEKYDEAIADFEAAIKIAAPGEMANVDPLLESAYYGLGEIYLAQGKAADAVAQLEKAVSIKRSDADALLLLGKAYAANGDVDKAGEVLRNAVAFVPVGWVEPYQVMADLYTKAGDKEHAAWANAMVLSQTGNVDEAIAQLTPLAEGPAALDATVGLGLITESKGDLAAARGWYTKALAIDPENDAARLGLGRVGAATPAPSATTGSNG